MTQTIQLPLWAFVLILLFAAVTFASHFLFPSVRWFFRKRMERAVARLNTRLRQPIAPFKLARRYDMIQRLIYDPQVTQAIVEHAAANNVPENVAFEQARRYAREIVPSFSATAYFTIGTRLARWLSRSLYQVRIGAFDRDILDGVNTQAAVVFVMNHRSNMDYVLVTYLAARAGALSYAVGEWARVWPLSWVIRAMGAFFIRRRSRGALYRKVLARYVQMATAGGVTQAVFPEGGLSLDGHLAPPRLGLLNYIVTGFDPAGREVVFVPVALNYDRILEDRFLIAADKSGVRRFRPPLFTVLGGLFAHLWSRLTGRFKGFGGATVSFGRPLSLGEALISDSLGQSGDPTEAVAAELMARVRAVMPVLPVPLVARALLAGQGGDSATLCETVATGMTTLSAAGVTLPRGDAAAIVAEALPLLRVRGLVNGPEASLELSADAPDILAFYANSIAHHFGEAAVSATAKQ
ncbi:MAG: glycerol-3-phosphate acyltransferase [Rhodobacterales bacterium]|nr:glycerol-3-phosphate acyltransferase [Rhodobacterales bacterium]